MFITVIVWCWQTLWSSEYEPTVTIFKNVNQIIWFSMIWPGPSGPHDPEKKESIWRPRYEDWHDLISTLVDTTSWINKILQNGSLLHNDSSDIYCYKHSISHNAHATCFWMTGNKGTHCFVALLLMLVFVTCELSQTPICVCTHACVCACVCIDS